MSEPRQRLSSRRASPGTSTRAFFGPVTLVANTGYITNDWFQSADIDQSSNPVQFQRWTMNTNQLTQEIRLVSAGKGPWEWIVGGFYFNENLSSDYYFQDSTPLFGFEFFNGGKLKTTSSAVFGQIGYDMRENDLPFKVVVGGRYTSDEKEINEYQRIAAFRGEPGAQRPAAVGRGDRQGGVRLVHQRRRVQLRESVARLQRRRLLPRTVRHLRSGESRFGRGGVEEPVLEQSRAGQRRGVLQRLQRSAGELPAGHFVHDRQRRATRRSKASNSKRWCCRSISSRSA